MNNFVIVNRDSIRSMLGDYWVPEREALVTTIETNTVKFALDAGYNVIIDATNLNPETIQRFTKLAAKTKSTIEFKPIRVKPWLAILRILWRRLGGGLYVPPKVIKGFYNRYKDIIGYENK